jgi:hypothetical protein
MEIRKKHLQKFASQEDYENGKFQSLGIPHVVLLKDVNKIIYKKNINDGETLQITLLDVNLTIENAMEVKEGNIVVEGYNIFVEKENNKNNLIIK